MSRGAKVTIGVLIGIALLGGIAVAAYVLTSSRGTQSATSLTDVIEKKKGTPEANSLVDVIIPPTEPTTPTREAAPVTTTPVTPPTTTPTSPSTPTTSTPTTSPTTAPATTPTTRPTTSTTSGSTSTSTSTNFSSSSPFAGSSSSTVAATGTGQLPSESPETGPSAPMLALFGSAAIAAMVALATLMPRFAPARRRN